MFDRLKGIWNSFGIGRKRAASSPIEEFESRLPPNAIVVPYTIAMTNPVCFIVRSPTPGAFLDYISKNAKYYGIIYVAKKSLGNGRYNYTTPNNYFGCTVDVG